MKSTKILAVLLASLMVLGSSVAYASGPDEMATYRVTIKNIAGGQPLSPPVAATHRKSIRMFQAGALASPELEALAEDGNQVALYDLLSASDKATDVVDVAMPLTPRGTVVGNFSDSATFEIMARPGDKLSLATMLICTNDGFVGLDAVRLPKRGFGAYLLRGYDAGTEDNTEMSEDIVDPCSLLGPVTLDGDPNGNEDAAVDSDPQQAIQHHPGIRGGGDLSIFEHGWIGPVGVVIVRRVD